MTTRRRWRVLTTVGLGLGLSVLTGCQTWVGGMTLPSGFYLQHRPQYFPPDPDFPLERELATMDAQNIAAAGALPAGAGLANGGAPATAAPGQYTLPTMNGCNAGMNFAR